MWLINMLCCLWRQVTLMQLAESCVLQEAWELMFDSVDTLSACVRIATGIISTIKINPERMRAGLSADMLATDLAEYLVRKGATHTCCCSHWSPSWRK